MVLWHAVMVQLDTKRGRIWVLKHTESPDIGIWATGSAGSCLQPHTNRMIPEKGKTIPHTTYFITDMMVKVKISIEFQHKHSILPTPQTATLMWN